ncbi:MAG: hypothetical protein MHM6MM_003694 [Cercozoa sp. M6MM]
MGRRRRRRGRGLLTSLAVGAAVGATVAAVSSGNNSSQHSNRARHSSSQRTQAAAEPFVAYPRNVVELLAARAPDGAMCQARLVCQGGFLGSTGYTKDRNAAVLVFRKVAHNRVSIQCGSYYMCADQNVGRLVCDRTEVNDWEHFQIVPNGGALALRCSNNSFVGLGSQGFEINRTQITATELFTVECVSGIVTEPSAQPQQLPHSQPQQPQQQQVIQPVAPVFQPSAPSAPSYGAFD